MGERAVSRRLPCYLLAALSGCVVWPTMTRPALELSIHDPEGRPVEGARVHFAQYSISMLPGHTLSEVETDQRGTVAWGSEREWQVFILAPDSGHFWSWSWCIEKPGYQAVLGNDLRTNRGKRVTEILLTPTSEEQACVWQSRPPAFEVRVGGPTSNSPQPALLTVAMAPGR